MHGLLGHDKAVRPVFFWSPSSAQHLMAVRAQWPESSSATPPPQAQHMRLARKSRVSHSP